MSLTKHDCSLIIESLISWKNTRKNYNYIGDKNDVLKNQLIKDIDDVMDKIKKIKKIL